MSNVAAQLQLGFEMLLAVDVAEPRREAALLLAHALGRDKTFLIAHTEYQLSETEELHYQTILKRRAKREPFQYIAGVQEFFGLDFAVTSDVLIPRPETEILVEEAINLLQKNGWTRFCEIGVGSGCIAVSILKNVQSSSAVGIDISSSALEIARRNAVTHAVQDRISLSVSDVFAELGDDRFDLIVSNPPYIAAADIAELQPEVRNHEPKTALTDGSDGLSVIRQIIAGAKLRLNNGGVLLIELGWKQSEQIAAMLDCENWRPAEFLHDLQSIPRILKAIRHTN